MKNILFLFFAGIVATNSANAQAEDRDTTAKHFLIKASVANLQEISAGQIAADKASDPEIKAFGKQMVTDHSAAQAKLIQVAKLKGITLPVEATGPVIPDPMLQKASGQEFDRAYAHMMVPGHRQAAQMFEKYSLTGKDPEVKDFATQTLPTIKMHLKMIKAIDEKLSSSK